MIAELSGFAKRVEAVDTIVREGVRPILDVDWAIKEKVDITFSIEKHRQAWESFRAEHKQTMNLRKVNPIRN